MTRVRVTVDAHDAIHELDRLARGPTPIVGRFEGVLLESFAWTQADVHVDTGYLKASGHPVSSFDGVRWTGTLEYARHPGIFELARGNQPSLTHPEGGHYFFNRAYFTADAYEHIMEDFLDGGHH